MKRALQWVLGVLLIGGVAWLLIPKPPLLQGISYSQAVYDRHGTLLRLTLSGDDKYRLPVRLAQVAPEMVEATLLYEDQYFYWHPGINPFALLRAAWSTYVVRGRRIGGSTLTMQVARLRFRIRSSTLLGKLEQIARALQLERHYTKAQILQAYLTLAPYGGNIEGVAAASQVYFQKDPAHLSLAEALTLGVIPQNPLEHLPGGAGNAEATQVAARKRLLALWLARHPRHERWSAGLERPAPAYSRQELPFRAPHFVTSLLQDHPGRTRLDTTLDLPLQRLVERNTIAYLDSVRHVGIRNAAVLLLDWRSMEVRAVLGSADFFDDSIFGQVNGTRARRSPGSALKPFIYALGLDEGLIHPQTMLKDAPVAYGVYDPENFDGEFEGPLSATDALVRSRNVPAIQLAARLHKPTFYQFLQRARIGNLREEGFYGLTLVLGGAEVTTVELSQLYAMLANRGMYRPVRRLRDDPVVPGERLLSPEASFIVLDMLKHNPRPDDGIRADWTRGRLRVPWKTGTSYAYRDAWSVGLVGPYVLAVWVGNFDGEGNPAFVGRKAAGPLFFRIVDAIAAISPALPKLPGPKGLNLRRVKVCAASGGIPGPFCPSTVMTWFIPGVSPIEPDTVYRQVRIDVRTGLRACSPDAPGTRAEVFEFWPSDLLEIFREAGIPRRVPPPYAPHCAYASATGAPPEITSPRVGIVYTMRAGETSRKTIPLRAVTDADVRQIYWFLDTRYLGHSRAGTPFFWRAEPGRFTLRAVDDQGRSQSREVRVARVD